MNRARDDVSPYLGDMIRCSAMIIAYLMVLGFTEAVAQRTVLAGDTLRGYYLGEWITGEEPSDGLEGKWVILDFWATWCKPCIAAFPHLNALVSEFSSDSVLFLAVTHELRSRVDRFLKTKQLSAAVVLDNDKHVMHKLLGVKAIPRAFVIGPDRVVRWTGHTSRLSREMLEAMLREP